MASFGPPPESNVLSYPGISGTRFNPIEAQKCWSEVIKTEKDSGYVHRMLDAHNKLALPQAWALDKSRRDGLLPSYESLDEVYYMTGWKKNKFGASQQPDIKRLIPALRQAKKEKKPRRVFYDDLTLDYDRDIKNRGMTVSDWEANMKSCRPRSSASSAAGSHRPLTHNASAPNLPFSSAPSPPSEPPTRRQRTAPSTPARSTVSRSASAVDLPVLGARSELSGARSRLSTDISRASRREMIASLVCSEVASQCSEVGA